MSGELHAVSLLRIKCVMKCMGIQPVGNCLISRLLCSLLLMTVVVVPTYCYYSFAYDTEFIFRDEPLSLLFDMTIYGTLITIHVIIVIEKTWWNSGDELNDQLEEILLQINEVTGKQVNLERVRAYCIAAYGSLFIRYLVLVLLTVFTNQTLIYYALYSQFVLLVSFTEFTLYSVVILFLYQELTLAGSGVLQELQRSRFELSSVRRLSLEKLESLQRIHCLLWKSIRSLEGNFHLSLITMLMKFFVDSTSMPYWIYLNHIEDLDVSNQFC